MKFWTKAFWKDAFERVASTALESLLGVMLASGFDLDKLFSWAGVWKSVTAVTAIAFIKTLLAGLANPNTGASLGTTRPTDIITAYETQTSIMTDGDKVGMGMPDEVIARPGDTVAGHASDQPNETPVVVSLPPSVT